jgi:NADPH-dependent 2,4-dienoyl-CoA reductase/sulfur reductase-like enzyme
MQLRGSVQNNYQSGSNPVGAWRQNVKIWHEPAKELPVLTEADILVAGGGPAGIAAAIAGARQGADTILLERYGCFGGMLTQAGVEAIAWYRHQGTVEAGGLLRELEQAAQAMGASVKECPARP